MWFVKTQVGKRASKNQRAIREDCKENGGISVERLTHEADFGLEDWEETLLFVKSDPNGAYDITDIAKHVGEPEFDEILKSVVLRLSSIENILGDDYDLDRLNEIVEADRKNEFQRHLKRFDIMPPKQH